jgi:hypothetical protein
VSHFSVYSSTSVGIFGAIISKTEDEKILQLDCLKTDFFHAPAHPTYLCFNPCHEDKKIHFDVGPTRVGLYVAVAKRRIRKGAEGKASVLLAADSAALIVQAPAGAKLASAGSELLANGVVVDYWAGGPV